MIGRNIRTSMDLLRPPATVRSDEKPNLKRSFEKGNLVYAKIYANNKWKWLPGVVMGQIGNVMCNVWIERRRIIRSNVNQMRFRTQGDEVAKPKPKPLPLEILRSQHSFPTFVSRHQVLRSHMPTHQQPCHRRNQV